VAVRWNSINSCTLPWRDSLVVSVLDYNDREIGVLVPLTAGGRVATVGQLLFAPRAWVYSTLHPFGVGK